MLGVEVDGICFVNVTAVCHAPNALDVMHVQGYPTRILHAIF